METDTAVAVRSKAGSGPVSPGKIKALLQRVLAEENASGELSVLFVDDQEIARLNAHYRKKNKPTDVLAFPAGVAQSPLPVLGDIVISLPMARRQARTLHHPVWDEIAFLLIHGTLHLLGYDHHKSGERRRMFARQDLLFEKLHRGR